MALGAVKALKGKKVIVVGFDGTDDGKKAVESGDMTATVVQQPDLMGSIAIENAVKLIAMGVEMKKVTMLDIAKRAGVSKATVSMVINERDHSISEETRCRILEIAKEMNYIPNYLARSLSTKKTGTIGIILPDITNPFFSSIARAIEDEASRLEYNVIFCNTDSEIEKEEKYVKLLISKLVDGVIFIAGGESNSSIELLKSNNIPFVLVDRYLEDYKECYGVYCLNKQGVLKGIEYLYSKVNVE